MARGEGVDVAVAAGFVVVEAGEALVPGGREVIAIFVTKHRSRELAAKLSVVNGPGLRIIVHGEVARKRV